MFCLRRYDSSCIPEQKKELPNFQTRKREARKNSINPSNILVSSVGFHSSSFQPTPHHSSLSPSLRSRTSFTDHASTVPLSSSSYSPPHATGQIAASLISAATGLRHATAPCQATTAPATPPCPLQYRATTSQASSSTHSTPQPRRLQVPQWRVRNNDWVLSRALKSGLVLDWNGCAVCWADASGHSLAWMSRSVFRKCIWEMDGQKQQLDIVWFELEGVAGVLVSVVKSVAGSIDEQLARGVYIVITFIIHIHRASFGYGALLLNFILRSMTGNEILHFGIRAASKPFGPMARTSSCFRSVAALYILPLSFSQFE